MHAWSLILGSVYVFHPTDEHFIAENLQKNSAAWKSLCFEYPIRGSYNCHRTIKHRFFCYFLITLKLSTSIRQIFEVLKQAQWWGRFSLRWNRVNYQTIYSVVKSFCIFIAWWKFNFLLLHPLTFHFHLPNAIPSFYFDGCFPFYRSFVFPPPLPPILLHLFT